MSLLFALLATPVLMADTWIAPDAAVKPGEPAPLTVRIPQFSGYGDDSQRVLLEGGPIVIARGQVADAKEAALAATIRAREPSGAAAWGVYFGLLFLLALLYTTHLRRSHRARLLRTQAVTLALLLGVAAVIKCLLLATSVSALAVPVAGIAIVATLVVDLSAGLATALVAAVLIGLLSPFDPGALAVLTTQGIAAVVVLHENERRKLPVILAGAFGGVVAAATYAVFYFLAWNVLPLAELAHPLRSAWVASAAGGLLSGVLALPAQPLYQFLLGDITKSRLVELEDLSHPLLKQIADNSPGTWQHSLAMANMAEIAANAIGANGRTVRVGAYFHDLGKSLQPKYFIENLHSGEPSPHDSLEPDVSCDAIFAHVTEGVRLARKHGLPERVIDFMHMHHGDGLLEYFWAKCGEQGNPKKLTERNFRYPGVKPQSRETAILAICDAVEAASRTLKNPDLRAVQNLVQRIVYGKLHLGQLDESGLSVADLRKISNSLMETIKHAHHGRIEYPWQREERASESGDIAEHGSDGGVDTARERPAQVAQAAKRAPATTTQQLLSLPRLDSLDAPRPIWRERNAARLELAPTERVSASEMRAHAAPTADAASAAIGADAGEAAAVQPAAAAAAPGAPAEDAPAEVARAAAGVTPESSAGSSGAIATVSITGRPRAPAADAAEAAPAREQEAPPARAKPPAQVLADLIASTPPPRPHPSTIELLKDEEDAAADAAPAAEPGQSRPDSQAEEIAPGVMVLGPPPKSRGGRSARTPPYGERRADGDRQQGDVSKRGSGRQD